MRIEVDSGGYSSATDQFYDGNHGVVDAVTTLSGALGGCGAMAGSDTGGQAWAERYDQAAGPLLQGGAQVGQALAQLANLSNASLKNHEGADFGSRVYGPPTGGAAADDSNPGHWSETVSAPDPPSAYGGTGDQPGWWHWIAGHIGGLLWPDADTGQLRAAGDAWRTAGRGVSVSTSAVSGAAGQLGAQRSPEVSDALATCHDVQHHMESLATAYASIGQACDDYAQQVDEHHKMIEDELKSFVEWTIGIEVGGAILGAVTLGIGEAAAQAAEAAKVAEAAAKVVSILQKLIEVARLAAARVGELVADALRVGDGLEGVLGARSVKALEETGELAAKSAEIAAPEEGMTVWRVGGEAQDGLGGLERGSRPFGESWTPRNPAESSDFRWDAGLPDENPGRFMVEGTLRNPENVYEVRPALELDGNPGGWPEYLIRDADQAVEVRGVSGVNEPWTRQPGQWAP